MKLYYSTTSPYSRKVRLVLQYKGLASQCEEVLVNPFNTSDATKENAELVKANPLGKIPTLILNNGEIYFDSPLICQYLDSLNDLRLIPSEPEMRLKVLRWEALTDGLTDAAFNIVMERRREKGELSNTWIANWTKEVNRTLHYIEKELDGLEEELSLAHLSLASAIAYLKFRLPEMLYDLDSPQLAVCPNTLSWYESFKIQPIMQATKLYDLNT